MERGTRWGWAGIVAVPPLLLVLLWAFAAVTSEAAGSRIVYPDVPIVAHTGGFGEPTCQSCHFDSPLNPPGGGVEVQGWPDRPVPGESYLMVVRVRHDALERAGFQLSIRTAEGLQAGTIEPLDDRSAITHSADGISYAHHSPHGTWDVEDRAAEWGLRWTAPLKPSSLRLHVVGNAANGDASEFGDFIYSDSLATCTE